MPLLDIYVAGRRLYYFDVSLLSGQYLVR